MCLKWEAGHRGEALAQQDCSIHACPLPGFILGGEPSLLGNQICFFFFFNKNKKKREKSSVLFNLLTLEPCTTPSTHKSQCPRCEAGAVIPAWRSRENPVRGSDGTQCGVCRLVLSSMSFLLFGCWDLVLIKFLFLTSQRWA